MLPLPLLQLVFSIIFSKLLLIILSTETSNRSDYSLILLSPDPSNRSDYSNLVNTNDSSFIYINFNIQINEGKPSKPGSDQTSVQNGMPQSNATVMQGENDARQHPSRDFWKPLGLFIVRNKNSILMLRGMKINNSERPRIQCTVCRIPISKMVAASMLVVSLQLALNLRVNAFMSRN